MPPLHFTWKDTLPSLLAGIFFIAQMIYGFFYSTTTPIQQIALLGVALFILSGIFGMAPVLLFPKKGGVHKGKSFVHTTTLVTTGIYSLVRHPQYSAFIYWALAAMCLFQDAIIILLGIPVILLTYYDMGREDARNIQKFGNSYKTYIKTVPKANIFWGIARKILHKKQ